MKKLLLDCCTMNTFSFNNVLYQQKDGVSMGSSLGPVLANIIMVELEREIIEPLISDGTLKFYTRYVDDTLVLLKPNDIQNVLNKLNSYHESLKFTVDTFDDDNVHFLDLRIRIMDNETDVYYKDTHNGQFTHFESYTPWRLKISWVRALFTRAKKICSKDILFSKQLQIIRKYLSWNGFPRHIRNSILRRLTNNTNSFAPITETEVTKIYFRVPYAGVTGEQLVKSCIHKMKRFLKKNVKFIVLYDTKKVSFFSVVLKIVPLLYNVIILFMKLHVPVVLKNMLVKQMSA